MPCPARRALGAWLGLALGPRCTQRTLLIRIAVLGRHHQVALRARLQLQRAVDGLPCRPGYNRRVLGRALAGQALGTRRARVFVGVDDVLARGGARPALLRVVAEASVRRVDKLVAGIARHQTILGCRLVPRPVAHNTLPSVDTHEVPGIQSTRLVKAPRPKRTRRARSCIAALRLRRVGRRRAHAVALARPGCPVGHCICAAGSAVVDRRRPRLLVVRVRGTHAAPFFARRFLVVPRLARRARGTWLGHALGPSRTQRTLLIRVTVLWRHHLIAVGARLQLQRAVDGLPRRP